MQDHVLSDADRSEGDGDYFDLPTPKRGRLHELILEDPVAQLNAPPPIVLKSSDSVSTAIVRMRQRRFGSVLVADQDGQLSGIFTEADLVHRFGAGDRDPSEVEIGEVMTRDPRSITEDDSLAYALNSMASGGYRHIPVVDGGKPVGFISIRGILRYLSENALHQN